jgi:hypothetical protein
MRKIVSDMKKQGAAGDATKRAVAAIQAKYPNQLPVAEIPNLLELNVEALFAAIH